MTGQTTLSTEKKETSKERDLEGFLQTCEKVGNACASFQDVIVTHHYDCDGIATGSITALALKNAGVKLELKAVKRVDEALVDELVQTGKQVVFCDCGSGTLSKIIEKLKPTEFAVIDHHELDGARTTDVLEANNMAHGFTGSLDASASIVAYFCFRSNKEVKGRTAEIALVGAVGDMQDAHGKGFQHLNRLALNDALEEGVAVTNHDLRIFGRVSRTVVNFLSYCTEPFLPGLTGNEKACAAFLQKHGIPLWTETDGENKWLHYYDLDVDMRQKLVSALVEYAFEKGIDQQTIKAMVGEVYLFPKEEENTELYDAYEFSTMLNATGRHSKAELGVAVCMGEDPDALKNARSVLSLHRSMIRKGIFYARKRVNDFGSFYFLDARGQISDTIIGTVAGEFLGSGSVPRDKPILAFSTDEKGDVKISGRGTKELLERGLDLNQLMREATEEIGLGGGHAIAAGASILEKGKENEFLKRAKEILKKQLG
ncbi:MAG: DHH family phosphoesterase [Candidatus Micrarchaeia archaeon]